MGEGGREEGEGTHIHMGTETVCQGSTLYHASTNSWLACVFFIMHDDFSHILAASFFLFCNYFRRSKVFVFVVVLFLFLMKHRQL